MWVRYCRCSSVEVNCRHKSGAFWLVWQCGDDVVRHLRGDPAEMQPGLFPIVLRNQLSVLMYSLFKTFPCMPVDAYCLMRICSGGYTGGPTHINSLGAIARNVQSLGRTLFSPPFLFVDCAAVVLRLAHTRLPSARARRTAAQVRADIR